ncbi:hypothetical protein R4P47_15865 [Rhodococcus sp. IEGM 1370]|uniref:hypothetical protein n=1 Tax=Rhodococcus sp. IEGM 1370 TaxID=3082222 RepID=UPI0029535416|nr:hypothetical protein [Rhodococcus sp. IEGM 1370]MDV8078040.1 hypothetical protein [Rhodococcus sp. IEGM 1370]
MNLVNLIAGVVAIACLVTSFTCMAVYALQPNRTSLRSNAIALLIPAVTAALVVVATAPYSWGWRVLAAAVCMTVIYTYIRSESQKQPTGNGARP